VEVVDLKSPVTSSDEDRLVAGVSTIRMQTKRLSGEQRKTTFSRSITTRGLRPNSTLSLPVGKFATGFQSEMYAILQCACENIRRAHRNNRILIISDSQAALNALSSPNVTSRLVVECLDALSELTGLNEVTLVWVPGYCGIFGNEEADKVDRQASAKPL
jgi:ribonuclease HI